MVEWVALQIVVPALAVTIGVSAIRALRGPSLPNRVVAIDLMATLGTGLACVLAIATGRTAFLDAALVLALVAFVGTIAFARYLERQG
jgi:multicomponent Na+:H+ antiporter subunit F